MATSQGCKILPYRAKRILSLTDVDMNFDCKDAFISGHVFFLETVSSFRAQIYCLHYVRILDLAGVDQKGEHSDLITALNLPVLSKLCFRKCGNPEDFLVAPIKAAGESPLKLQHLSFYHWKSLTYLFHDDCSSDDESSSED